MSNYEPVTTETGTWAIDWSHVHRIVSWYHKSELMLKHWRKSPLQADQNFLERWVTEPVFTMEVDWEAVRTGAQQNTAMEMQALRDGGLGRRHRGFLMNSEVDDDFMRYLQQDLHLKVIKARENKTKLRRINEALQKESMTAIGRNVDRWQTGIDGARFMRDVSVDIIVIGVGILTGGAGSGVAAALRKGAIKGATSGVLKGSAKWQDTSGKGGSAAQGAGAGAITLTTEVIANILPVKMEGGTKLLVVAGVKGVGEGASAIVAGDDMEEAFAKAVAKAGAEVGDAALQGTVFKNMIGKKPIPVKAGGITGFGSTVAGQAASKRLSKLGAAGVKAAVERATRTEAAVQGLARRFSYYAALGQELSLLRLAVVPPQGYTVGQAATMLRMAR